MSAYDFSSLSPADFENLSAGLLSAEWGQRLEVFKSGRDGGIDLRYSHPRTDKATIVQCKHYKLSGFSRLLSDLKNKEFDKISRLRPSRYVIMTSVPLNPDEKDKIKDSLSPYVLTTGDILGRDDINLLLGRHPQVEQENFKLWLTSKAVLDRVVHNAQITQTEFEVERIAKKLPLYVQNACFPRAQDILRSSHVVIISGEPGVGKTTLAEMLLYSHMSEGFIPNVIKGDLKDGMRVFHKEKRQIFYFDDFLGQTFLRERHGFLLRNEDQSFVDFMEMVANNENSRLIMTTREHILANALIGSDRFQRSAVLEHKCVLSIGDYSQLEKARILYNHIYFSNLPEEYTSCLLNDAFYIDILKHRNFNPRLIEWLANYRRVKHIPANAYTSFVKNILDNPEAVWNEAFEKQISAPARSLLLSLFTLGVKASLSEAERSWSRLHSYQSARYNYSAVNDGFAAVLREIEGGFVKIEKREIQYLNPSIRDFLSGVLQNSVDRVDDLIETSINFSQLFNLFDWFKTTRPAKLTSRINPANPRFVHAIHRVLAKPSYEKVQSIGIKATLQHDVMPEARLHGMLVIAITFQSDVMLEIAKGLMDSIENYWEEEEADFEQSVKTLELIERSGWPSLLVSGIYEFLRSGLMAQLAQSRSCEAFSDLYQFLSESQNAITVEESKEFKEYFWSFLENDLDAALDDINPERVRLSSFEDFLNQIADEYAEDVSEYLGAVQTFIEQLDRAEERSYDDYRERTVRGHAGDWPQPDDISNLFDSLRS